MMHNTDEFGDEGMSEMPIIKTVHSEILDPRLVEQSRRQHAQQLGVKGYAMGHVNIKTFPYLLLQSKTCDQCSGKSKICSKCNGVGTIYPENRRDYKIDHVRVYERCTHEGVAGIMALANNKKENIIAMAMNDDMVEFILDVPRDLGGKRMTELPPDTFLPWTKQFKPTTPSNNQPKPQDSPVKKTGF